MLMQPRPARNPIDPIVQVINGGAADRSLVCMEDGVLLQYKVQY